MGADRDLGPIRAEPQSLERATPDLIERLRADSFNYFRFVNRPWIARVCEVFAKDLEELPTRSMRPLKERLAAMWIPAYETVESILSLHLESPQ